MHRWLDVNRCYVLGAFRQHCHFRILISNIDSIMYFILYNFVQLKLNFVHLPKHDQNRFSYARAGETFPQHCQCRKSKKFNFKLYSIMYFILYNFVQLKLNFVHPPKHDKNRFSYAHTIMYYTCVYCN